MKKYIPNEIEPKWQKKWEEERIYSSHLNKENKFYCLAEFAYPSGDLHMGHWFTFGGADIFARMKRMQGFNVFFPNGFDAFGLPAENAAIKKGIHPKTWTLANIEAMRKQFSSMGASFSFDHQVITCLPEYYHWNQWIFLKMFEKGIAYRDKKLANWCPSCQTVLADEQVVDSRCDRCSNEVVQKEIPQWFLRITQYADRLLWSPEQSRRMDWPKAVKEGQNNWIGRSEGMILDFDGIKVFTTRPETTDGATFLVLAPEHSLTKKLTTKEQKKVVESYIKVVKSKSEMQRKEEREKTGVFTGSLVKNPVTGKQIPVWIADYVLMGYGTGAIMAVPYADERDKAFAEKFHLPIIETSFKATPTGEKKINYHLHDWSVSRQRYWGTPVPVIHCDPPAGGCGLVPVPEKDLPVVLPEKVDFTPKGKAPLETAEDWINVKCPKCGGDAKRDSETLDGFFDNSWYFLRYLDPQNKNKIFDGEIAKKWLPVDIYFGGAEHTLGHTLYSRFFTKFLFDLGLISVEEYANRRVNHGIVLGPDGEKMSKSRGNVVNPDLEVKKYGADAVRIHVAFFMPYDGTGPWVSERIEGAYRFLQRVWSLASKVGSDSFEVDDQRTMHKTIKKVTEDIENIKFNTAIASLMEWLNHLSKSLPAGRQGISKKEYETFLLLLAPFAPHIAEELFQLLGNSKFEIRNSKFSSIHQQSWPTSDKKFLEEEEISVVLQINGKVRDILVMQKDSINSKDVVEKKALESQKAQKFLQGKKVEKTVYIPGKIINFVIGN